MRTPILRVKDEREGRDSYYQRGGASGRCLNRNGIKGFKWELHSYSSDKGARP